MFLSNSHTFIKKKKSNILCGDHFCLKLSVALIIDFGLESHIEEKPPSLAAL